MYFKQNKIRQNDTGKEYVLWKSIHVLLIKNIILMTFEHYGKCLVREKQARSNMCDVTDYSFTSRRETETCDRSRQMELFMAM